MPELIHTFLKGKMNKDLDERLVPNGEYRDALNLEVATSEGSDVGSLQTLLGNVQKINRTLNDITTLHTTWPASGLTYIPTDAKCIGTVKDATTEKIYWFITSQDVDAIVEYDQVRDVVFPILVDKTGVLKFSENFLITGVNILEGFLFFTDNQTEPKKIEIQKFKDGSTDFNTHTQIFGRDFIEADITVIKKSPLQRPIIYKKNTVRDGAIKTTTTFEFNTLSTNPDDDPDETISMDFGTVITLNWTNPVDYIAGDFLLLTIQDPDDNFLREFQARVKVTQVVSEVEAICELQSVGEDLPAGPQGFDVELEQDDPLFEFKFPRFAYRYKYDDNQFSTFSPFTEIAFIPGDEFEYTGVDGYNLAMTNNIRVLEIRDFITPDIPDDVIAVDILYKESNSTNVYRVDTIEKYAPNLPGQSYNQWNDTSYQPVDNICQFAIGVDTDEPYPIEFNYTNQFGQPDTVTVLDGQTINGIIGVCGSLAASPATPPSDPANISIDSYPRPDIAPTGSSGRIKIETELISSLLPSNQLLRPYDNVPKKALAQEITGNRIIYGNYTQNFDMVDFAGNEVIPNFEFSIVHDPTKNENIVENPDSPGNFINITSDPDGSTPVPSLKSMRTYQMGVVYLDQYGRQTPVFTNDSGGRSLAKEFADLYNTIEIGMLSNPPKWATHYKFYVKETSNEYYNLALDRFYLPEDGSVWLSFPSADRNKVDEETFLELKKEHDNNSFIEETARYKILAISNEAPDAVKIRRHQAGRQSTSFTGSGYPQVNKGFFEIPENDFDGTNSGGGGLAGLNEENNLSCRIISGSNISDYFEIEWIKKQGPLYRVQLRFPTDESLNFIPEGQTGVPLDIAIYQARAENKPEYQGRFFVKIYKDNALEQRIIKKAEDAQLTIEYQKDVAYIQKSGKSSFWRDTAPDNSKGWFWDKVAPLDVKRRASPDVKYQRGNQDNRPYGGLGIEPGSRNLTISFHGFGNPWKQSKAFYNRQGIWWNWPTNQPSSAHHIGFAKALDTAGSTFRISDDPDKELDSHTYNITMSYRSAYCVANRRTGRHGSGKYGSRRVVRWNIKIDKPIATSAGLPPINTGQANPARTGVEFLRLYAVDADTYTSNNPAIFETYPKEAVDLDLYYSASDIYEIENAGTTMAAHQPLQKLDWFNCYSFGQGVESDRIRDDFNATRIDKGPVVSTVLDEAYGEETKATGLIFSQIFNSTSGINRLNQFIAAEPITKDLNPYYTSVQKLHSRDTDLIAFCEDKVLKILANKDALFNADGNTNIVGNTAVLGQSIPFIGEYGISKNPESFASYGFRAYFTDKNRGVVLRLSRNGLEEISAANMRDFFADNLHSSSVLLGSYDDDKDVYNLTLNNLTDEWKSKLKLNYFNPSLNQIGTTVSFKEDVKGWTSRKDFIPEGAISLNNKYYSIKSGRIWEHGAANATRNNFYGVQYDSAIRFLMNDQPNIVKKYKTLNYSGTESREYRYQVAGKPEVQTFSLAELQANPNYTPINEIATPGWYTSLIQTNLQEGSVKEFLDKEGKYFNYIKGIGTQFNTNLDNNLDAAEFSMQGIGRASVSGDVQSSFIMHVEADPSCFVARVAPVVVNGSLVSIEDCTSCPTIDLANLTTDNNVPAGVITYDITADNTNDGALTINNGIVTFTPNANFNGDAGAFNFTATDTFNGSQLISNVGTVTITVDPTPDIPYFTSSPPTTAYAVGDTYTYNVAVADADHTGAELTITSSNLPSWLTLTDNGDGTAIVTGVVPDPNPYSFDLVVSDPDTPPNTSTQNVEVQGLANLLSNLDIVGRYVSTSEPQGVWVDPNTGVSTTVCASPASGGHSCSRGTFNIFAIGDLMTTGLEIGRVHISNTGGGGSSYYDSDGNPTPDLGTPTGNEKYYTPQGIVRSTSDRYSSFQISQADAQTLANGSSNGQITFYMECGTFTDVNATNPNCHSNALWFNIFDGNAQQILCTAFTTGSLITIDIYTGQPVNPIP